MYLHIAAFLFYVVARADGVGDGEPGPVGLHTGRYGDILDGAGSDSIVIGGEPPLIGLPGDLPMVADLAQQSGVLLITIEIFVIKTLLCSRGKLQFIALATGDVAVIGVCSEGVACVHIELGLFCQNLILQAVIVDHLARPQRGGVGRRLVDSRQDIGRGAVQGGVFLHGDTPRAGIFHDAVFVEKRAAVESGARLIAFDPVVIGRGAGDVGPFPFAVEILPLVVDAGGLW